jgi:thiamine pyrophosphokinase
VHARRCGRRVDVLVGDLDSIPADLLRELSEQATLIERHPVDKDRTDLALAIDAAAARGATTITIVGGHGGRLDHLLANVLLLAAEEYASCRLDARLGPARVAVVRGRRELHGQPDELLTLLPVGGVAQGVTTEGLRYPLHDADLVPGVTWGVSNHFVGGEAAVVVRRGVLLAVQPGPEPPGAAAPAAEWGAGHHS